MRSSKLLLWILFAYCFFTIFELGLPAVLITGIALFMSLNYTLVRITHIESFNAKHEKPFEDEMQEIKEEQKNKKEYNEADK